MIFMSIFGTKGLEINFNFNYIIVKQLNFTWFNYEEKNLNGSNNEDNYKRRLRN